MKTLLDSVGIRKCPECGFYSEGDYCLSCLIDLDDVKEELLWKKPD